MKQIIFPLIGFSLILAACNLYEEPISQLGKEAIFNSESGLATYSWSFYDAIPSGDDQHSIEQTLVDYISTYTINTFLRKGAYNSENSSGWSWTTLRNINWFIENCEKASVDESIKNNYLGLARFFRAYFYYDKVRRFGDVPWIDHALDVDETDALMAPRDSREMVMENVWKDLEFAEQNITRTRDNTCSLVTKWVAYAFASRVALFEGTYRKYHNLNLSTSANIWLERSAEAAKYVMDNSGYKLHTGNVKTAYRDLFINTEPKTDEIMMAIISSKELTVLHSANRSWTQATFGSGNAPNFIRPFICSFLQTDGTPYTNREGWETETFYDECQNRDARLSQIIRTPGYTREGKKALPDYKAFARIGYQPIKLCVDETNYDNESINTNALSLFRYGEILLNYAEAKAELGNLSDADWAITVGALRARAGITGSLTTKPNKVDEWFQNTFYPNVGDATILEIRRERAIELCLEGFRFDDLRRWACGNLLTMSQVGIFVPVVDEPLDMDGDGAPDVIFYTSDEKRKAAQAMPGGKDCQVRLVSSDPSSPNVQIHQVLGGGYYLTWGTQEDNIRVFGEKQYLYPIPASAMIKNPNLTQNPGWENNASNDGN